MRHFLWPLLLITINAGDIQRDIVKYLDQYYPLENGQYICDASAVNFTSGMNYDSVAIDGFGKEPPRGLVVAKLSFYSAGKFINRSTVSIKIGIIKPVLVTSKIIKANESFTQDNVAFQTRDVASLAESPLCDMGQLTGLVASHYLAAGQQLTPSMLMTPPVLKVGDHVEIKYSHGAISLTAAGVARENGCIGERIKVTNTLSHRIISATVVDASTVAIGDREEF
jgi:flagellar basal body P-ring formation protein FlgA